MTKNTPTSLRQLNKLQMKKNGFTLIEILLVVAAISILAGIVILAINPGKQLAESRNAQRRADVKTILEGIYQWNIDNGGTNIIYPTNVLSSSPTEICHLEQADNMYCFTGMGQSFGQDQICLTLNCYYSGLADFTALTYEERYLNSMPVDPKNESTHGTGYQIRQSSNGRITVSAPLAELGDEIEVTR